MFHLSHVMLLLLVCAAASLPVSTPVYVVPAEHMPFNWQVKAALAGTLATAALVPQVSNPI